MPVSKEGEKPVTVDLPEDCRTMIKDHFHDIKADAKKDAVADLIRRGRAQYLAENEAPKG